MFVSNKKFREELAELRNNVKLCERSLGIPDHRPDFTAYLLRYSPPVYSVIERVGMVEAKIDRLLEYLGVEDYVIPPVLAQRVIRKKSKSTKTTKREK